MKRFVRDQAIRGADPERVREGLLLNGWDKKDVDNAIKDIYGLKKKIKAGTQILIVLIVLILALSLLLIFRNLYFGEPLPVPEEPRGPLVSNGEEQPRTCADITDMTLKEECYLEKIEQGFSCESLSEEETFYCNRVLESHLLDAFS